MLSVDEIAEIVAGPFEEKTARNCHAASLAVVKSGRLGKPGEEARVARGFCKGVSSQHSWIVLGNNPYFPGVPIIDVSLWSYDKTEPGVWQGRFMPDGRHVPHGGWGSIMQVQQPRHHGGPIVRLPQRVLRRLSPAADAFLSMLGPLDRRGWNELAHAPVIGWPAREIISAMYQHKELSALVPIDVVGMVTDHNPGELYW